MNITKHSKALGAFVAAAFAAALASDAQAGPAQVQIYRPVKTMQEAQGLKVGAVIAYSCGNCGATMTTTVPRDQSQMKGFTCAACGSTYRVVTKGGKDNYLLVDNQGKSGHLSTIRKF